MVCPRDHFLQLVSVVGGCVGVYVHVGGCVITLPSILQLMPVVKKCLGVGGCVTPFTPLPSPPADDCQWAGSMLRLSAHREGVV